MTHLRLVAPFDGGAVPDYPTHDGRPVTWQLWKPAPPLKNVRLSCGVCSDVDVWCASGLVERPSYDSAAVLERARVADGFTYGFQRDLAALPELRLFAFRCSSCGDTTVFDMGESGAEWVEIDLAQGALW
jgi:hypothetical protein